ncbi:MAG: ATP-binding protein [Oscillospiraceae bacterium]|nr:ATP-binding protein [Oscillospiraceae bacterium]
MALDGRLLRRAMDRLEEDRRTRETHTAELRQQLYRRDPALAELDARLQSTAAGTLELALRSGEDPVSAMEKLQERSLQLQKERAERIIRLGSPEHCIDDLPACPRCGDRGYLGREPCECLLLLYREEQRRELSKLLDLKGERFSAFQLDYYDDQKDPETGISPRQHMQLVFLACRRYAETFDGKGSNLFLSGAPGLGKTFLSACIASVVSENGWSVVYDTTVTLCARFEEAKFRKQGDPEAAELDIRRYLGCDLLILDDLGTEMSTAYTVSVLYELINSRLRSRKSTVISSNLSLDEIGSKYSPQIASRLAGEYENLKFYGRDIRKQKNEV